MNICLKTHAKQMGSRTVVMSVQDRKPARVSSSSALTCTFKVDACSDYYLLTLDVTGVFEITCQRCLADFQHTYANKTILAMCSNDDVAEKLMETHECIVVPHGQVDLIEIVTDDLHLFLPEKHPDFSACDVEMSGFIGDIL